MYLILHTGHCIAYTAYYRVEIANFATASERMMSRQPCWRSITMAVLGHTDSFSPLPSSSSQTMAFLGLNDSLSEGTLTKTLYVHKTCGHCSLKWNYFGSLHHHHQRCHHPDIFGTWGGLVGFGVNRFHSGEKLMVNVGNWLQQDGT